MHEIFILQNSTKSILPIGSTAVHPTVCTVDNNIDSFFSLPTQHRTYQVRGFAQLEKAKSEEFSRAFEWQKMPASWRPDMAFSNAEWIFVEWNRSEAFTKECMPPLFGSDLFWERTSGVVYFDMNVK